MVIKIDPPFSFSPESGSPPIEFGTDEDLKKFVDREVQAWQSLRTISVAHNGVQEAVNAQSNSFVQLLNLANTISSTSNATERVRAISTVRSLLSQIQSGHILISTSKPALEVLALFRENPGAAGIRLARLQGKDGTRGQNQTDIQLTRAVVADFLSESDLKASIDAYEKIFDQQRGEFDRLVAQTRVVEKNLEDNLSAVVADAAKARDDINSQGAKAISELSEARVNASQDVTKHLDLFKHQIDEALSKALTSISDQEKAVANDIEKFRATLRAELRLQAPATYWQTKAQGHRIAMISGLVAFGFAAIVIVGLFFFAGPSFLQALPKDKQGDLYLGELAVLTIPAFAYFWLMRYLGRFFVTNHAAAADAKLRATMTETFLALAADGRSGIGDAERLIILQALFRPTDSTDQDAPPPNLLEIITRFASGEPK